MGSVVVPLAVFGVAALQSYGEVFREAENRGSHIVNLLEEHAAKTLEAMRLVIDQADERLKNIDVETLQTSRSLWNELNTLQGSTAQVDSIFVLAPDGTDLLTTRTFPVPPGNFSDRDYFIEQREQDRGLYIGQSYIGKISRRQIFNLSIRRFSPDGSFNGVVGASAYVPYFEAFYSTAGDNADNFSVSLVRADGKPLVVFSSTGKTGYDGEQPFVFLEGDEGGVFTSGNGALDSIHVFKQVKQFPVYVVYSIERQAMLNAWYGLLVPWGALTLVVGAALFLTTWLAMQRARQEAIAVAELRATTEELHHEIERRKGAEAALLQAQRLEAVGQLTGGIAHDFNNLLTVLVGNLELADRKTDLQAIRKLHGSMRYATQRAEALTQQLLAFSRRQTLHPRTLDLNALVSTGAFLIRRAVGENIEVVFDLARSLWPVRIDGAQFEAAFLNLAVNARDAMPEGGKLAISTSNIFLAEEDIAGRHPGLSPGAYVRMVVRDTGTGMPPEVMDKIFEPFFTTKDVGQGTGLGMSQIYGFVQQSGGSVQVASTVGEGTIVTIYLPRSMEEVHPLPPASRLVPVDGSGRILVVEDEIEVQKIVVAALEELGYEVLAESNGVQALKKIQGGLRFDFLLTDITLPGGISGIELARETRSLHPDCSVLLMTGYPLRGERADTGEFPVIFKPFTWVLLSQRIGELMEERRRASISS